LPDHAPGPAAGLQSDCLRAITRWQPRHKFEENLLRTKEILEKGASCPHQIRTSDEE
jgi:hypothetical protein